MSQELLDSSKIYIFFLWLSRIFFGEVGCTCSNEFPGKFSLSNIACRRSFLSEKIMKKKDFYSHPSSHFLSRIFFAFF